jgi:HEAT repeat protein
VGSLVRPLIGLVLGLSTMPVLTAADADPDEVRFALRSAQQKLRSADAVVRQRGAEALGELGPLAAPAVPDLVRALSDLTLAVGAAAKAALPRVGAAAIAPLTDALDDPDVLVRQRAADVLGTFGPQAAPATSALARALDDEVVTVRERAVWALGRIGPAARPAAAELEAYLASVERPLRPAAIDSLLRIGVTSDRGRELRAMLDYEDWLDRTDRARYHWRRERAPMDLATIVEAAVHDDPRVRLRATEMLAEFRLRDRLDRPERFVVPPDPLFDAARSLRDHDHARVRGYAPAFLLALLRDERSTAQAIAEFLPDRDADVRLAALEALLLVGGAKDSVAPAVIDRSRDPVRQVRIAAIRLLEECTPHADGVCRALERALDDADAAVRAAAQRALSRLFRYDASIHAPRIDASADSLGAALQARYSDSESARRWGQARLDRIVQQHRLRSEEQGARDTDELFTALCVLRQHPDERVRWHVAALLHRAWPDALETVQALAAIVVDGPDGEQRLALLRLRNSAGPKAEALPALMAALKDDDRSVRFGAAWVLAQCGTAAEPARELLEQRLAEESDERVGDTIRAALNRLGTVE